MRLTEYMDYISKEKITNEDRYKYTHIDINNPKIKEARKKYQSELKKLKT